MFGCDGAVIPKFSDLVVQCLVSKLVIALNVLGYVGDVVCYPRV